MSTLAQLARLLAELLNMGKPLVDQHLADRLRSQQVRALAEWSDALRARDLVRMERFVDRLLQDAGEPLGMASGRRIELDVEYIDQLVRIAVNSQRQQRELNQLLYSLQQQVNR